MRQNPSRDTHFPSSGRRLQNQNQNKSSEHTSDWLHCHPFSSLGLKLANSSLRAVCVLRIGTLYVNPSQSVLNFRGIDPRRFKYSLFMNCLSFICGLWRAPITSSMAHRGGSLFDPLQFVSCIYRTRTRFTKINDFLPFSIFQDTVKLLLTFFQKKLLPKLFGGP